MKLFGRSLVLGQALVVLAASVSCGTSGTPTAPSTGAAAPSSPVRRIVVLGDSLAVSPSRAQNFPSELQSRVNDVANGWSIANAGISGDTTAGGLRRFDEAVTTEARILVLALGANDGLRGIDIATIERNLSAMIERARERGIRVLLCGMETPPTHGWDYTVEYHRLFRRLASGHGIPLVPFLLAGVALNPEMNGSDSLHPNAAGARRIADNVWPYLEPLVREESLRSRQAAEPPWLAAVRTGS